MRIKAKQILAIIIGVFPFYAINIYSNLTGKIDYTPELTLFEYPAFSALILLIILSLHKFLLKKKISDFNQKESSVLYDISIAFLFLICYYFLLSAGQITYTRWLNENIDQTEVFELARRIYENPLYVFMLFGPFVIITQGTWVLTSAFVLNNLWGIFKHKWWDWAVISVLAAIIALVNFHNGIQGVIFWFTVNLACNIFYYKYRRITPLLIAYYISQWFDFIGLYFFLQN